MRTLASTLLPVALLSLLSPVAVAHSNDEIVFVNGNSLKGEINGLIRGKLSFGIDGSSDLSIDWDDVQHLVGPGPFKVELSDGTLYFGSLMATPRKRTLVVDSSSGPVELPMGRVVNIGGLDSSFWDMLSGYINLGLSFTKASEVTQFSFSGGLTYSERLWRADLTISSILTSQKEADDTSRNDVNGSYQRDIGRRWFAIGGASAQQNSELGLDLRASLFGGAGRRFVQTNTQLFSGWAGLAASHEVPSGIGEATDDLSGVLSLSYEIFDADSPSTSITATLAAFPYVTQTGRVRSDFNLTARKEIISDFYWDLSFYASYDNQPVSLDAATSDYGIVTSLGYSF